MKISKEQIRSLADKFYPVALEARRHIHQHPELSFEEFETSKYITSVLSKNNITYRSGIVKTGIVGHINDNAGRCIALRADIDALPIEEKDDKPYKSSVSGVMHACGHDVHTACLIGALLILNEVRSDLKGSVKFLFQPGEEKLPGGASLMIKEGVLKNPEPSAIIGQHVYPSMEKGKVGFRKGMYMASTDELYLTIKGKGGHAAMVKEYNSPILIASKILLELNDLFMTEKSPAPKGVPTVLAFGDIVGKGATNVIPDHVKIEGTFRTMNEAWRKEAHDLMITTAKRIARENNGDCDFVVEHGYPFLVNDEQLTARSIQSAKEYLGDENVEELDIRMTAEDFAYYSQIVPACFYRLGTGNKSKGITSGVHTPTFDIDEESILTGMGLMAWLTINELNSYAG